MRAKLCRLFTFRDLGHITPARLTQEAAESPGHSRFRVSRLPHEPVCFCRISAGAKTQRPVPVAAAAGGRNYADGKRIGKSVDSYCTMPSGTARSAWKSEGRLHGRTMRGEICGEKRTEGQNSVVKIGCFNAVKLLANARAVPPADVFAFLDYLLKEKKAPFKF